MTKVNGMSNSKKGRREESARFPEVICEPASDSEFNENKFGAVKRYRGSHINNSRTTGSVSRELSGQSRTDCMNQIISMMSRTTRRTPTTSATSGRNSKLIGKDAASSVLV